MTTPETPPTPMPPPADPQIARSLKHSIRDGASYAVMTGCGESYFSAFAIYLKASTAQIGFIASVPLLLASLAQLFSAWLGHYLGIRKPIILIGAGMQAAIWLPLLLLPILAPKYAVELLIVCIILYHMFSNLAAPQWSSLMGELVSENRRGRFFARRTAISSMTAFVSLICAGLLLYYFEHRDNTLAGFVLIFAVAFAARLVSVYQLSRMHEPGGNTAALENPFGLPAFRELRDSSLLRFSVFFMFVQFSVSIASPFFSVYLLRDLQFNYLQFMACAASTVLFQFVALQRWGRISDIFGNRVTLKMCGLLIPAIPFLWLLSPNFYYLLTVQAFGGFIWAGFSLSASNYLYDLIPKNRRVTWMAAHSVMSNTGVFFGALLGGWLGTVMAGHYTLGQLDILLRSPLYNIFMLSFVLRLATMLFFIPGIRETRKVRSMTMRRLIFRVIAFKPLAGLSFEIITSRKSSKLPG
jgi:MFS family permease